MKTYYCHFKSIIILLLFVLPLISFSQVAVEINYAYNSPLKPMNYTFNNVHGMSMAFLYSPKKSNYYIGLAFQSGFYGKIKRPIEFAIDSTTTVSTQLSVNNSCHNFFIYHKYNFRDFVKSERIEPFVDFKTGWSFFRTDIYIEDPNEPAGECEPLYNDIVHKDNTWLLYAGAGFEYKLNGIFNSKNQNEFPMTYLSLGVGYTYGGNVSYMNVEKNESTHNQHSPGINDLEKTAYYTQWLNTQTQIVHQHHTGYLYTSPIRMLEVRFGIALKI